MDTLSFLVGICIIVIIYLLFVTIISNSIKSPNSSRKSFWWVFFLGLIGAIIYILLEIRDK